MDIPLSFSEKVVYLSKRLWEVCKSDVKYAYCFLAAMVGTIMPLLFAIYLLLWITSFVDSGYL